MPKTKNKKHFASAVMIVLIVLIDQVTKQLAISKLETVGTYTVIEGFLQFTYTLNEGIAFSLFESSTVSKLIIIVVTALVCALILGYMYTNRCKSLWLYWSLGVLVAGGLGNLIDRVTYGFVVDFIEFTFVDFAVFNIADCAVTLGAASFIIYLVVDIIKDRKRKGEKQMGEDEPQFADFAGGGAVENDMDAQQNSEGNGAESTNGAQQSNAGDGAVKSDSKAEKADFKIKFDGDTEGEYEPRRNDTAVNFKQVYKPDGADDTTDIQ